MATGIPVTVGELVDTPTINTWARGWFRKHTAKTVNNTTTQTDLLNGECTLPAGALGLDKIVRLTAWGNWKHAMAAGDIPKFLLLLGGTTLLATDNTGGSIVANDSGRWSWRFVCEIQNLGAANAQQAYLKGSVHYPANSSGIVGAVAFITGNGLSVSDSTLGTYGRTTHEGCNPALTVDTTAACALAFQVWNSTANTNYETRLLGALVEII